MKVQLPQSYLEANGQSVPLKNSTAYVFFPQMGNGRTTLCLVAADPDCTNIVTASKVTRYVHDRYDSDLARRYALEKAVRSFDKTTRTAIWQKYLTVYPPGQQDWREA